MSVEGVDETKDALQNVLNSILGNIPGALEASAILVQGDAKLLQARIKFGNLNRSISRKVNSQEQYATVGTNVEYGQYHEFGTSKMTAQPFLRPALDRNRSRIIQIMKSAVKKGAET